MTGEGEVSAVNDLSDCNESQMRNHEIVTEMEEKRFDQNLRQLKIVDSHIDFKDEFIKVFCDLESFWDGQLCSISTSKHRVNQKMESRFTQRNTGRAQNHESLNSRR